MSHPQPPAPAPQASPWTLEAAAAQAPVAAAAGRRVSQDDRDRVVDLLKGAYVDGRLDVEEFQERTQTALAARTPADLAAVLTDVGPQSAAAPHHRLPPRSSPAAEDRGAAVAAHLLGLFTSFIGPLVMAIASSRDKGFAHDQAVEALNFQLTVALVAVALVIPTIFTFGLVALLYVPLGLAFVVLPLAGAATAAGGHRYRYPGTLRLAT